MRTPKKNDLRGPSWTAVILGAILSFVLGIALSAAVLILTPITAVKELPKEPAAGVVYYIEGTRDTAKGWQAHAKEKIFLQGGSVVLNEDELNLLASPNGARPPPRVKPAAKADPGKPEKTAEPPAEETLTAGPPNFRLRGGVLQIGVPLQMSAFGFDQSVVVQARGGFTKSGEIFVFNPSEVYVGSCPLQRLPAVREYLLRRFLSAASVREDLGAAWQKLTNVAVEGSALHLTMQ